jgi:23S rRNA (cytidine1920-2'-O)/16S rRNA (cytidine1409-2'-O)-methyltransferase
MAKRRVDLLLLDKGLTDSRAKAQRLVMAGQVRVDGQVVQKPSMKVLESAVLTVDEGPLYVSRGGEKLAAALAEFPVSVQDLTCADVGASTGGFTDCLLQNGAAFVIAIDVGKGILDWRLRNHPQVQVMEGVNARYLEVLPKPVDLITVDVSFISLNLLLPVFTGWFTSARREVIALIKPQFEAGREQVKRGKGVIRDPEVHHQVLVDVLDKARAAGYTCLGLMRSPLHGPKGNVEFLAWLRLRGQLTFDLEDHLQNLIFGVPD